MSSSHLLLLVAALGLLICKSTTARTTPLARLNCTDRCGETLIPYPFGSGQGCYKNKWFEVICNRTSNGSTSFLKSIKREIVSFSLQDSAVNVLSPMVYSGCSMGDEWMRFDLGSGPFFISSSNRLTTVGCNSKAMLTGWLMVVGCEATCEDEALYNHFDNMSCVGYQCCQTTIPRDLQEFNASVESFKDNRNSFSGGCQVAFLTSWQLFPYMFELPDTSISARRYVRMQIEWRLDNFSDIVADSSFKCRETTSTTLTNVPYRYQCKCEPGYEGNPYISGGCQDIDECRDHLYNDCGKDKCVNVPGSYKCEKTWPAVLGISLGSGFLFLAAATWWMCKVSKKRKRATQKRKFFKRNGGLLLQQKVSSTIQGNVERTRVFSSKELEKATDKFSRSRILGQGGQGTVYKGMLADGSIIAVKRSKVVDKNNLGEFINEIIILSQINHQNIVKILGCCLETEVPILVYEFIPNGNLFQHLHNQLDEFPMSWEVRLRIAAEAANAISYLHAAASFPIYHRDIKSTNILLDQNCRAKVSDFGISRSVTTDKTHLTTIVQGTKGYVDPEYFQSNQYIEKSDVYSFGVVLVELLGLCLLNF